MKQIMQKSHGKHNKTKILGCCLIKTVLLTFHRIHHHLRHNHRHCICQPCCSFECSLFNGKLHWGVILSPLEKHFFQYFFGDVVPPTPPFPFRLRVAADACTPAKMDRFLEQHFEFSNNNNFSDFTDMFRNKLSFQNLFWL